MKNATATIAALWLCLSFAVPAHSAEEFRGHWTLSRSSERGKVRFAVSLRKRDGLSKHASNWPITAFGVLDLNSSGKQEVTFVIERASGRLECRGFIEGGEGAGAFTFKLSKKSLESMRSPGDAKISEGEQFASAVEGFRRGLAGSATAFAVSAPKTAI